MLTVGDIQGTLAALAEMKREHAQSSPARIWSIEFPRWTPMARNIVDYVGYPDSLFVDTTRVRVIEIPSDPDAVHVSVHFTGGTRGLHRVDLGSRCTKVVGIMRPDDSVIRPPQICN